jgi:hypothetical protein
MNEERMREYEELPRAESSRLINFDEAEIVTLESFPPQYVLVVRGTKPYLNMEVDLVPLVYVRQPEYWGIEVVGRLRSGIGLTALAPYTVSIPLAGSTGTKGVEVVGASRSEKIEVPPVEPRRDCYDWSAWHDRQPVGPSVLYVRGKCEFPTAGYSVELEYHAPQGINPRDLLLNMVVHEPADPVADVITDVDVNYEEETDFEYDTVTILGYTSVPVEVVQ